MKKVTQHLFSVLVAVLSLSAPGAFVNISFTDEKVKLNASVDKGLMPQNVLESMLRGWVEKVKEYCSLNTEMDISKQFLKLTRNEDGTFTADSSFTGEVKLDAYPNAEEAFKAALERGMELELDYEHRLAPLEA